MEVAEGKRPALEKEGGRGRPDMGKALLAEGTPDDEACRWKERP